MRRRGLEAFRQLVGFLLLSLAAFGAAIAAVNIDSFITDLSLYLAFNLAAYAAMLTALILSVRFDRLGIFCAILPNLFFMYLLTGDFPLEKFSTAAQDMILLAAWYFIPINTLLFALVKDGKFVSWGALIRLLFIVLALGGIIACALSPYVSEIATYLSAHVFTSLGAPKIALGGAAIVAVYSVIDTLLHRQKTLRIAYFISCVAFMSALAQFPDRAAMLVFFTCGALIWTIAYVQQAFRMAYYDELTGILGRRALIEELGRLGKLYTIAMVDIDFFKKFNDKFGHETGDQVLKMVAIKLEKTRGRGSVYRYGGEEFTLLFRGKKAAEAMPYLEELREEIASTPFTVRSKDRPEKKPRRPLKPAGAPMSINVSIGAADSGVVTEGVDAVVKAADQALYKAKETGRNRVVLFDSAKTARPRQKTAAFSEDLLEGIIDPAAKYKKPKAGASPEREEYEIEEVVSPPKPKKRRKKTDEPT